MACVCDHDTVSFVRGHRWPAAIEQNSSTATKRFNCTMARLYRKTVLLHVARKKTFKLSLAIETPFYCDQSIHRWLLLLGPASLKLARINFYGTFGCIVHCTVSPSKVFERCSILKKFQSLFTTSRSQFGFKKGTSYSHAMRVVRSSLPLTTFIYAILICRSCLMK